MVKTRRRRSSQGDDVSLLDDPDESPPRYSMQASNGGSSSIRKSKSASNNRRSGEAIRSSALPPENRFVPQHDPKAEARHVPRQGALQFVPAYEESTSPVISTQPGRIQQQEEAPAPTWDAIIEADGGIRGRSLSWGRKQKAHTRASKSHSAERSISSVESAGTGIFRRGGRKIRGSPVRSGSSKSPGSKRPLGTALPRTSVSPAKQRQSETSRGNNVESASAISAVSSSKKGKRIGRLASLFSSKAREDESPMLTPETKRPLMRKDITPVSPARSESSNDYSGWPGTQDKRGGVVAIQSSYDDSSVGAAGVSTFHRKKYELEMDDDAVEEEVRKWMNDPSFDDSTVGTDPASPQRKPKKNVSYESRGSSRNVSYESKGSSRNISYESSKGSSRHSSFESSRIMSEQSFTDEDENPADFHLAALVANAAPRSPLAENTPSPSQSYRRKLLNGSRQKTRQSGSSSYASFSRSTKSSAGASSVAASSATGALSMNNLFGDEHKKKRNSPSREVIKQAFNDDPWEMEEYEPAPSSAGTSVSKSSSAFFQTRGVSESRYGIRPNMRDGASTVIRRKSKSPTKPDHQVQPPTEEALARNERYSAAQRGVNASNIRGYRGYLDKTKDVPNLMDALDSESASSSKATSAYIPSNLHVKRSSSNTGRATPDDADEEGSDIFDGLSATGTDVFSTVAVEPSGRGDYNDSGIQEKPKGMNVVRLAGGLTAIQTTQSDLDRRGKAHDFDENLTNSSVDNYGYTKLPAFREMAVSGRKSNDTAKYIPPSSGMVSPTGQPIRAPISTQRSGATPRNMFVEPTLSMSESGASAFSENAHLGTLRGYYHGDLSEYCVNPRQAKQLVKRYREVSAARSKYLSREQLSKEEDAKKAFALLEMRSRVMEKDIERGLERQGGTVPVDDLVTTPYNQAAHRVRDAVIVSKAWRDGASPRDVVTAALLTRAEERTYCVKRPLWYIDSHQPSYYLEPVTWLDDTDFMQLRCPSLGPRCMRGFEIFTIGDCQSILLKLTNERCMELRRELNEATARQLEAEELMKEEGDAGDGMMTDAEMRFLASMEEVKTISKRLVVAEKAFELVRERIEKLVAKYETLLVKIENDSIVAPSSVLTNGSSYYTDGYESNYSSDGEAEKLKLEKRAQRAELRAEVAAREALMAKQEAEKVREEKQRELEALQQKLDELQAESSTIIAEREREQSAALAKTIAHETQSAVQERTTPRISQEKINGVKQKFRDRMAERMRSSPETALSNTSPRRSPPTPETMQRNRGTLPVNNRLRQTAGEEMFSHLDFYERSLKSVERSRATGSR